MRSKVAQNQWLVEKLRTGLLALLLVLGAIGRYKRGSWRHYERSKKLRTGLLSYHRTHGRVGWFMDTPSGAINRPVTWLDYPTTQPTTWFCTQPSCIGGTGRPSCLALFDPFKANRTTKGWKHHDERPLRKRKLRLRWGVCGMYRLNQGHAVVPWMYGRPSESLRGAT